MARYIDAEKLTEIVEEHSYELTDKYNSYGVGMFAGGIFQAMEEAEVDVKEVIHGKWLTTDAYPHRVYCSVCYETNIYNEELCFEKNKFPIYCMWCGAKNELKGDEE